jgi:Domain of unknown function (DU1801)
MGTTQQIEAHLCALPEPKRSDMEALHRLMLRLMPRCKLWFLDGKDDKGKIVSNPNVGYGTQVLRYANGTTKAFYQIGICATTTGISVYLLGLADKAYLARTYGKTIGKAKVTGYCITFKSLRDISTETLEAAVVDAVAQTAG